MICVNEGVKLRRRVDANLLTLRREIFFGQLFATAIATIISHPISVMDCVRVGCAVGSRKSYSFANFVTLYQTKNAQLFSISVFCEGSR